MSNPFLDALQKTGLKDVSIAAEGAKLLGYLHTGNFALNWIISNKFLGGWPLGHVTEIFGDPSTGKSYLIARAIGEALRLNGVALLDDTEGAFNAVWANQKLGVDTSRLAYRRSSTVGEHMESIVAYIEAYGSVVRGGAKLGPSVLALDSLALLTTEHEQEVGVSKVSLTRAKEIRTMFRVTGSKLSALPVAYIIANHTIANIGDFFNDKTTPGGGGPKFQASVRVELRLSSKIKTQTPSKQIVGVRVKAVVDKNRLAVPWRTTDLVIPFYEPISAYSGLVPLLLNLKVLEAPGRNLVFQGEDTKIKENKSDFIKQDHSAEELIAKYPDLLSKLDTQGDLGAVQSMEGAVEEDAKSDPEG